MTEHVPERDLIGYGPNVPIVQWPGDAAIAISLVINYEEGSELTPLNGDASHEMNGDLPSNRPAGLRDRQIESQWEYGSRAGIWRLFRIMKEEGVPFTLFGCGMALEKNPDVAKWTLEHGASLWAHGYRWIDQWHMAPATEAAYIRRTAESIEAIAGQRPRGWFTKNGQTDETRRLLAAEGFEFDSDGLDDDLPYYTSVAEAPWLVIPYSLDSNDGKFWRGGWHDGRQFLTYLRDSFDVLYAEGQTAPRMLNVGLHARISGRPGRAAAVREFIRYAKGRDRVWFAGRDEIADWWRTHHPGR